YLLTEAQLKANEFPGFDCLPATVPPGFIRFAAPRGGAGGGARMLAIDCEMCQTEEEHRELTRISVVGEDGTVLLDTLVKPHSRITDYVTRFSGITPEMMRGVTTTRASVSVKTSPLRYVDVLAAKWTAWLSCRTLKIMHDKVIDTSLLYPNLDGSDYKNSLKSPVSRHLGREMNRQAGHCSIDDATACMHLVLLKI
ncbi:ribonuclease H-like domain-containing protein, partial [Baffinella frigidus]